MHKDNYSFRCGFDYYAYRYHEYFEFENYSGYYIGKAKTNELRVGIEKSINQGHFGFYYCVDLVYGYGSYLGIVEGYHSAQFGLPEGFFKDRADIHYHMIGLSPVLGLKYQPFKLISISVETGMNLMYGISPNNNIGGSQFWGYFMAYSNPIRSLSLNYHFNL